MFSHKLDATARYRTLARGSGSRWVRTYAERLQVGTVSPQVAPLVSRSMRPTA
jgi:hypothetical protein